MAFLTFFLYFTDNVQGVFNAWLIGLDFLRDAIGDLTSMKNTAVKQRQTAPYLYDFFNIHGFYSSSQWGINRMLTPFVDALNEQPHLPKLMLFLYDKDFLCSLRGPKAFTGIVLGAVLHYTIKQIDVMIDCRITELTEKKLGAVTLGHPKIIWVRMLKHPASLFTDNKEIFGLRGKFNSILEERLHDGVSD